jgi:hypothetical protein
LNILCAYTDLVPETKRALDPWNPEYVNVSSSPLAYWAAVRERWAGERDLVNIEHDVIIHERVILEFTQCDRLWCTFPYPCAQGGQFETAAGCARYSKYLQQLVPVPEIERAVHWAYCDCPPECSPGICWHHMDAYLVEAFQRHGVSVHLHEGAAGHV